MQTPIHIDKAGRIVIPKEMRDELGLSPDQPMTIEQTPEGILLRSAPVELMVERFGIWSYQPHVAEPYDPVAIVHQTRDER